VNRYFHSSGQLSRKDNTLLFETEAKKHSIPVETTTGLFLFGEITLNTRLLNFCAQKGVVVHVFNHYGNHTGTYLPHPDQVSGDLVVKQAEHQKSPSKRLLITKSLVGTAGYNMSFNLRKAGQKARADEVKTAIQALETVKNVEEAMGVEGRLKRLYYEGWQDWMGLDAPFLRNYRPPDNGVNALLSFLHSLLYATLISEIHRTALYPGISFLHSPQERRNSLALDLSEPCKPVLADRLLASLLNQAQVTANHFMAESNGVLLTPEARKLVVQAWDEEIRRTAYYKQLKRNCSYRQILRRECYQLIRHLLDGSDLDFFRLA
jgi:CRISPR-associated protein Cas1